MSIHSVSVKKGLVFAGVLLVISMSACQPQAAAPQATSPTSTTVQLFTVQPISTSEPTEVQETPILNQVPFSTPFPTSIQQAVDQAKADLAKRLNVDAAQIEVLDASTATWPDKGLGCPKPGMAYAQVTVEGLLIRLRANGQAYEYHSGGGGAPFLCEKNK
jgi:hypothetical protein